MKRETNTTEMTEMVEMTNADWNGLTSFYRGFFSHVGRRLPFPTSFTRVDAAFYFSYLFITATERIRMLQIVRTDVKLDELYNAVENVLEKSKLGHSDGNTGRLQALIRNALAHSQMIIGENTLDNLDAVVQHPTLVEILDAQPLQSHEVFLWNKTNSQVVDYTCRLSLEEFNVAMVNVHLAIVRHVKAQNAGGDELLGHVVL